MSLSRADAKRVLDRAREGAAISRKTLLAALKAAGDAEPPRRHCEGDLPPTSALPSQQRRD